MDRFHIQQDRPRARIAAQVVENVAEIRIQRVAHGDEMGKTDAPRPRPIQHGGAHGARLAGEGDVAGQGGQVGEAGVKPDPRHQQAETVGAQQAHAVSPRHRQDLGLCRAAAAGCRRGAKPGRQHDGGAGAVLAQIVDDLRHGAGRCADDRQVGDHR